MWFFLAIHGCVFPYHMDMIGHDHKAINFYFFFFDEMDDTVQDNLFEFI
jgi:hypothetical protein